MKVNDQAVHDTSDFTHAVKSRNGNSVSVGIVRDKREQNLNLMLPARKESSLLDLEEESFDEPLLNAESALQMSEITDELAKLRPQMELASQNARKAAEQMQKTFCDQQRKATAKAKVEAEKQARQFKREQEKLQRELERMSQEMRKNWLNI